MVAATSKKIMKRILTILFLLIAVQTIGQKKIIVDINGSGDFTSIQAAINSIPDTTWHKARVIFIKNGLYNEKLMIEKHQIIFEGESREKVIITQSISRDEFRCDHKDDWGVATVNVNGNDITFLNLTIKNNYGFEHDAETTIPCLNDTVTHQAIIRKSGHQMALRTMKATRFRAINCTFSAFGGDTVSPWNVENGMFYFKDCRMEGGVDFYCPRGWAWAENCEFYAHSGTASIWHDGSKNPDSKSVLMNCKFSGFDNFFLGRYHRESQMYLVNCNFDNNMRDSAIYQAKNVKNSTNILWGHRIYYSNCHRKGGDFDWFQNNLPNDVTEKNITINWVFKNQWNPEKNIK
jgi:pectinesterase